jgi:hypothetical protein
MIMKKKGKTLILNKVYILLHNDWHDILFTDKLTSTYSLYCQEYVIIKEPESSKYT